jgi:hypothetical protein
MLWNTKYTLNPVLVAAMKDYTNRIDGWVQNGNILLSLCLVVLFGGCAFDLVHVKQIPTAIDLTLQAKKSWILVDEVELNLGTGYGRRLNKGTRWDYVGKIEQGEVFKTKDQILTVEGSNIFEADIVVSEDKVVGFYLPVEKTFSPLNNPRDLNMEFNDPIQ